jgi:amidohydrolase
VKDWTELGLRGLPELSARARVESVPPLQEFTDAVTADCRAALAVPVHGITADGRVVPGVFTTGREAVDTDPLREASEDFAYYLEQVPGCFFGVGAGGSGAAPHHHHAFDIDERAIGLITEVFPRVASGDLAPADPPA